MIRSLQFRSGYPLDLDGIGPEPITFSDRINLVIGPNGAGKSTVLYALARQAGCGAGGWSQSSPATNSNETAAERSYSADIVWDGRPVFFQDCYRDSDNSFIDTGYIERKEVLRSTGEKRIGLINELVDHIEEHFPTFRLRRHDRPTLILDEIDNHVGFAGQSILWKDIIPKLSKKYQLILASHSIFPILLRQENPTRTDRVIELSSGYIAICIDELNSGVQYFNAQGDGERGYSDEDPNTHAEWGVPGI